MRVLVFIGVILAIGLRGYSQDFSNKGREFWIAYGNHVRMFQTITSQNPAEKMQLYMTSDVNTTGTVEIAGINFTQTFTVTANQITTIDIPRTAALLDEGTYKLGIHVTAAKPIVVYSFIYVNAVSGATVCLPVATLGKTYYSVNFTQVSNEASSHSFFDVIATDTGTTTVEIIPSQATKTGRPAGQPFTVDLKQGEVYQVLGQLTNNATPFRGVDLTGSQIRSIATATSKCKKIAVFCGSGKITIGCPGSGTADNLYQQMYPVNTWGKTYIGIPSINKTNTVSQYNYYRIFQSDVTGIVKVNGSVIPAASFISGRYYDFNSNQTNYIESDKPILVAQYLTTQDCDFNSGQGDPDMIYLNPLEQTISSVTLNSMQPAVNTNLDEHYINVVLKNDPSVISSFKIDGGSPGQFKTLSNNPAYSYGQFPVKQGTHTMTCDSGFNAIAYGFGKNESYGYSAGTNLKDLYQFVSIVNQYATVNFPAACRNSPFQFSMTFPYRVTKLTWQFKGLFPDTTILNPVSDSSWDVNGKTLYRYQLNRKYLLTTLGTFPIVILADNLTGDDCSGQQEISYDLQVFERPKAAFGYSTTGCISDPVQFSDSTDAGGRAIIKYNWLFGDNTTAVVKSPLHTYQRGGNFTVSYSVITDIGCISDTSQKTVQFTDLPVASFTASQACENKQVSFVNQSTPSSANIKSWLWKFGDSTSSALAAPVHTFAKAGTYAVSLNMETISGCKAAVTVPVRVNVNPVPNFSLPKICESDLSAQFFDSTKISDNSGSFSYLWNFGDIRATAANPNTSAAKDAVHSYTASGVYKVKLQVTSVNGCSADTTKDFTVNGSTPKAAFDLATIAQLCSNQPVSIFDRSSVDFGKITKVEMYWDYANDPTQKDMDQNPGNGKAYTHTYTEFGSPATRSVQILYIAYSGISCLQQVTKTVDLLATPQFALDSLTPVCAEATAYQLPVPVLANALTGNGVFSGEGVSSSGLFTPLSAKAGTHVITYRFVATNSCSTTKTRTITVFPTPLADAGPDRTVLEGGSLTIAAKATANSQYSWSPLMYLDNPASLNPVATPVGDISYQLKVVSGDGCTATDQMSIIILKNIKVPNAFSPNGDGINDTWRIQYLESYPGATVQVYNRYGQLVFSSVGYSREWNGTMNGSPLPIGTYYWIIDPKNGRPAMNGSLTIIR